LRQSALTTWPRRAQSVPAVSLLRYRLDMAAWLSMVSV